MRKLLGQLITMTVLLSACTGTSLEPLKMAEPIQEKSAVVSPIETESTSRSSIPASTDTPKPAFTPVSANIPGRVECSSLALERSLILTKWERPMLGTAFVPYDPELGAPLCDFMPIAAGQGGLTSISPDGRLLAYALSQHEDMRDGLLYFVDLRSWTEQATTIEVNSWIAVVTFSPDSQRLAIAFGMPEANLGWPKHYSLIMVDVKERAIQSQITMEMAPRLLSFTPDGRSLMLYGVQNQDSSGLNGEPHALLLESDGLETQWDLKLEGVVDGQTRLYTSENTEMFEWWGPAAVLSSEKQVLYIVHADSNSLTTVDFARHIAATVEVHTRGSWFERFLSVFAGVAHAKEFYGTYKQAVLSPDGTTLYVVGSTNEPYQDSNNQTQINTNYLGLQVIETANGTETAHIDTEATNLAISQDGKKVFLHGWKNNLDWTDILETSSLKITQHITGRTILQAARLDGEPLFLSVTNRTGAQSALAFFDPDSYKQGKVWSVWGSAAIVVP